MHFTIIFICINDNIQLSGENLKLILIFRTAFYFQEKKKNWEDRR